MVLLKKGLLGTQVYYKIIAGTENVEVGGKFLKVSSLRPIFRSILTVSRSSMRILDEIYKIWNKNAQFYQGQHQSVSALCLWWQGGPWTPGSGAAGSDIGSKFVMSPLQTSIYIEAIS